MGRRSRELAELNGAEAGAAGGVVARTFDVLRCFDSVDANLSNGEIAARSGLPRSTVSRLTSTLTRIGQLAYSPIQLRYRLGPAALAMATSVLAELHLRPTLDQMLRTFTETTPGTVGLLLPAYFDMVYVAHARGHEPVGRRVATGDRVPMGRTAGGHAHVARLPPDEAEALIAAMAPTHALEAHSLREQGAADRESLATSGYVTCFGIWHPESNGCAVPLRASRGDYVLTIGVRQSLFDRSRVHAEVGPRMLGLARDVERLLEAAALRDEETLTHSMERDG